MKYILRQTRVDEFGNIYFQCPQCMEHFKQDGIGQHLSKAKGHEKVWEWYKNRQKRTSSIPPEDWPWKHLSTGE